MSGQGQAPLGQMEGRRKSEWRKADCSPEHREVNEWDPWWLMGTGWLIECGGKAGEGGSLVLASAGRVQGEGGGAGLEW